MTERLGEIAVEGTDVSIRIKHRPWYSNEQVKEWFTFSQDGAIDLSLYGIPRADNRALPRVLRTLERYRRRYPGSQLEEERLEKVGMQIRSIINLGKLWPEDF